MKPPCGVVHWLDMPEWTRRCLIGTAPRYPAADSVPVSEMAQRRHYALLLVISSSCRRTVWTHVAFGRFLYSVNDCGTLPRLLCDTGHNTTSFGHSSKTFFLRVL